MCPRAQEEARNLQVFLAVAPREVRAALQFHNRLAHVAYRIGSGSVLLRQNLLLRTQGGLLSLSDAEAPAVGRPEQLARQIWQECGLRGYGGVLADFEEPPTDDRAALLIRLRAILQANRRRLYVPEAYGPRVPGATVVVCTALSGGSFRQRMQEAADRWGASRVALDVQRLMMDFPLPSPTGEGDPLTVEQLAQLWEELQPSAFYSRDLCARYFTYTREGKSHFVVFDDADTMRTKIRSGAAMGFAAAFLTYPETKDLLHNILA